MNPPNSDEVQNDLFITETNFNNQSIDNYENQLRELSGLDDKDIFRKRMF
jgi:hypothetical protein